MTATRNYNAAHFVLFPAIAMLLGWGLRGYIGGGPYGAMIPGCFVALTICLLLNYKIETASMAAVFGAIGIGFGGQMTYGQTLGFLHEPATLGWGLLGCTIKGGVWGLLGGAVLGLGLSRDKYDRKSLVIGLLLMVAAFHLGRELINEPRLIYFSNLVDRPRDESWAGMLFAAITLLGFMRTRGSARDIRVPLLFAGFGGVGGALGFGGGALWLAFGPDNVWIGWWKMMEFTFGFVFGGALGWCAYRCWDELRTSGQMGESPPASWPPMLAFVGLFVAMFGSFALLGLVLPEGFRDSDAIAARATRQVLGMVLSFTFFGSIAIIISLFSQHVAWHVAITLTFFHTVHDFVRDLDKPENFGYVWPGSVQWTVSIALAIAVGAAVYLFQHGARPTQRLFLLAVWSCYATACVRSFGNLNHYRGTDGESGLRVLLDTHPSIVFVHGTFTVSAILVTVFAMTMIRDGARSGPTLPQ